MLYAPLAVRVVSDFASDCRADLNQQPALNRRHVSLVFGGSRLGRTINASGASYLRVFDGAPSVVSWLKSRYVCSVLLWHTYPLPA